MKRSLFLLAILGLFGAAIVGCRVSGEVDPDTRSNIAVSQ
jgi:hypothetical protein